ncbi:MAG: response regulator [Halomonas sp.]
MEAPEARPLILCAEDQDDLRTDICEELQEAGYAIIEAADGKDTLQQLQAMSPDLILCDINMPGENGYEILQTFRRCRPDLADTPFIFLTALSNPEEVVDGKRAGADDYLIKPIDFDLLLATIDARLRQVKRMREKANREIHDLRQAMVTLNREASSRAFASATRALDLVAPGMVLLDRDSRVLFANRAARQLADDENGLHFDEKLLTRHTRQARALRDTVQAVISASQETREEIRCLRLNRRGEHRDLLVMACSLGEQEPAAVLLLSDPEKRARVPRQVLASLFGLTPTEAHIALLLADGHRTDEIADLMNISPTTVAFHLRNLFQKTDTHRQADLIALILAGSMTVALEATSPSDTSVR